MLLIAYILLVKLKKGWHIRVSYEHKKNRNHAVTRFRFFVASAKKGLAEANPFALISMFFEQVRPDSK